MGTTFIPELTEGFKASIAVAEGQQPTEEQWDIYKHNREFLIPTFNRDHKLQVRFLVTVPDSTQGPAIWMETLHPGLTLKYAPNHKQVLGVSVKTAVPLAMVLSIFTLMLTILFISEVWIAGSICILVGLFAQHIAVIIYRGFKFIYKILLS